MWASRHSWSSASAALASLAGDVGPMLPRAPGRSRSPSRPGAWSVPSDRAADWSVASLGNIDSTSGCHRPGRSSGTGSAAATPSRPSPTNGSTSRGGRSALPVGTRSSQLLAGEEPSEVYGALAALLAVLIPLAGYLVARACLEWPRTWSLLAGSVLAINSSLLFAEYYGWHGTTRRHRVCSLPRSPHGSRSTARAVVATPSPARCSSQLRLRRIACRSRRSSSPSSRSSSGLSRVQSLHPDRPSTGASGRALGHRRHGRARGALDRRTRPRADYLRRPSAASSPAGWGSTRGSLGSGNRAAAGEPRHELHHVVGRSW